MSKSLSPRSSMHWVAGNGHPVPLSINPFMVASTAALVLGLSSGWPEPLQTLLIVPLLLGGLIHGAVDLVRLSRLGFISLIPAAGIYLFVACLSLLCFVSYPLIGLAAILVVSAAHFGVSDTEQPPGWRRGLDVIARGAVVIIIPIWLHPQDVGLIFVDIAGDDASGLVGTISQLGPLTFFIAALAMLVQVTASNQAKSVEWGTLILLFFLAPPVLAFAVYFAFLHSARHLQKSKMMVSRIRNGHGYVVAASLGGAFFCIMAGDALDIDGASALFPGLFALTVPHILLEILGSRRWFNRRIRA